MSKAFDVHLLCYTHSTEQREMSVPEAIQGYMC